MGRRIGVLAFSVTYLGLQVFFILRAHFREDKAFGFQMFAESSRWSARLFRELPDGRLVQARGGRWTVKREDGGPVLYAWDAFVRDFRLSRLEAWKRAKTGMGVTLKYLERALSYVAERIPEDRETRKLLLEVRYSRAGGPLETVRLESPPRNATGLAP